MNTAPPQGTGCGRTVPELTPGSCIRDAKLPDGHDFSACFVLPPGCKVQFLELDYSRIVPPEDDEQYQFGKVPNRQPILSFEPRSRSNSILRGSMIRYNRATTKEARKNWIRHPTRSSTG